MGKGLEGTGPVCTASHDPHTDQEKSISGTKMMEPK